VPVEPETTEPGLILANVTDARLAELTEKYAEVGDVTTPTGYESNRLGIAELRTTRTGIAKAAKVLKAPHQEAVKAINEEQKRITDAVKKLELPMKTAKDAEDARRAEVRAEKERKEAARVAAIQDRIMRITEIPMNMFGKPALEIAGCIAESCKCVIDEQYEEFQARAEEAKTAVITRLKEMLKDAEAREEEEQRRVIEEKARQEQLAKEQAAREAEQKRLDAERAELEAQKKAEAEKAAARQSELRKAQAEADMKRAEEQKKIEAEKAVLAEAQAEQARKQEEWEQAHKEVEAVTEAETVSPGEVPIDPEDLKDPVSAAVDFLQKMLITGLQKQSTEYQIAHAMVLAIKDGQVPHVTFTPETAPATEAVG